VERTDLFRGESDKLAGVFLLEFRDILRLGSDTFGILDKGAQFQDFTGQSLAVGKPVYKLIRCGVWEWQRCGQLYKVHCYYRAIYGSTKFTSLPRDILKMILPICVHFIYLI
jgi:hypothetical protein